MPRTKSLVLPPGSHAEVGQPLEVTILALDPSTDVSGVALLGFGPKGQVTVLGTRALVAGKTPGRKGLAARFARIRRQRADFAAWAGNLSLPIDLIAYERSFQRGGAASVACPQAAGALLTVSALDGIPVAEVTPQAAKAVYGKAQFRAEGTRSRDADKQAAREWAARELGVASPSEDEWEAVADACAVACAAYRMLRRGAVK